ncbi:hypothetical protein [Haloarchaeobius sp. TZWWS8]|uniref:hypothetical protein n=1 Tax=Haloarchaeobius sp. TZWWS8 TaxID=3446121 RepID=UPI003EBA8792
MALRPPVHGRFIGLAAIGAIVLLSAAGIGILLVGGLPFGGVAGEGSIEEVDLSVRLNDDMDMPGDGTASSYTCTSAGTPGDMVGTYGSVHVSTPLNRHHWPRTDADYVLEVTLVESGKSTTESVSGVGR